MTPLAAPTVAVYVYGSLSRATRVATLSAVVRVNRSPPDTPSRRVGTEPVKGILLKKALPQVV
jgi:hypothetical protein